MLPEEDTSTYLHLSADHSSVPGQGWISVLSLHPDVMGQLIVKVIVIVMVIVKLVIVIVIVFHCNSKNNAPVSQQLIQEGLPTHPLLTI